MWFSHKKSLVQTQEKSWNTYPMTRDFLKSKRAASKTLSHPLVNAILWKGFLSALILSLTSHQVYGELYFNAKRFLPTAKLKSLEKKSGHSKTRLAQKGGWKNQHHTQKHKGRPVDYAHQAEKKYGIPENLLSAIAFVESKCSPYAINARGRGYYFKTKGEAASFVRSLRAQGVGNINVGYMQLNLPSHIKHFSSVDHMLDISRNIDFAARLLSRLYKAYGSWPRAVERYKSSFSEESRRYQGYVYRVWTKGQGLRHGSATHVLESSHKTHETHETALPAIKKMKRSFYTISYADQSKKQQNPRLYPLRTYNKDVSPQNGHAMHYHHEASVWGRTYAPSFLQAALTHDVPSKSAAPPSSSLMQTIQTILKT